MIPLGDRTLNTRATQALQSNKPLPWVSAPLGYAGPALALRTYAHAIPQQAEDLSFADPDLSGAPEVTLRVRDAPTQERPDPKAEALREVC